MLYSQNSSKKSLLKGYEDNPPENGFSNLGFYNVKSLLERKEDKIDLEMKKDIEVSPFEPKNNDSIKDKSIIENRGLSSFGRSLKFRPMESPMKPTYFCNNENNSRLIKQYGEEGVNCSMLGVIDDNSNNIDHGFMFINDKHSMHNDNMNIENTLRGGLHSKMENQNNNIFENNMEHSNISELFPIQNDSNMLFKQLFGKDHHNEKSELKPESPLKENDAMQLLSNNPILFQNVNKTIDDANENNRSKQFHQLQEMGRNFKKQECKPITKISEDIKLDWDRHNKEECSLPHPMDLFRLKDANIQHPFQNSMIKSNYKSIYK